MTVPTPPKVAPSRDVSEAKHRDYLAQRWRADRLVLRWGALAAAILNPAGWATDLLIAGWGPISQVLLVLRVSASIAAWFLFFSSNREAPPKDFERIERLAILGFCLTVISGILGPTILRPTSVAAQGGPLLAIILLYAIAIPVWHRGKVAFFLAASLFYILSGMMVRPYTGYGGKHELVTMSIFLIAASILGPGTLRRIERLQREVFLAREDLEETIVSLRAESAEREKQAVALEKARHDAQAANEAKSYFLASVSHDLRTPIAGILNTADFLADTPLNADQTKLLDVLRTSSRLLLAVVNDIMDLSKLEAGKLVLETIPTDIREVFNTVGALLSTQAKAKGIEFEVKLDVDPHPIILSDPVRCQQILLNLAGNAVKFTSSGRVEILVAYEAPRDDHLSLYFEVRDTGIGMSPETMARMFQPFAQADVSTSRKFGGTGLGLVISKRLVDVLGGTIAVESELGKGSTFRVRMPVKPAKLVEAPKATAQLVAAPLALRILVAEDNDINALIVARVLTMLGHTHTRVANGQQAVDAALNGQFDVILMDMHMPVMDGLEAVQVIRKLDGQPSRVPIIALTADAVDENRSRYLESGIDGFLTKPYHPADLSAVLEQVVHTKAEGVRVN